jgi:hypothetical protein
VPLEPGAPADRGCSGSTGKGVIVKTSLFASILLSTFFYTNLLLTMFVMSLVLAARDDVGMAPVARDAQVWERSLYAPAKVEAHRASRLPQTDAPIDKYGGPDAAMIKPGKARAKTIKM